MFQTVEIQRLWSSWKPAGSGWRARHGGSAPAPAGRAAALRAVRPDDAPALSAFVAGLSPATRRARFHAAMQGCPPAFAARLAAADGRSEVALVAVEHCDDGSRIVGEARFALDGPGAASAEFAIAVADDRQGRGLAQRLMQALIEAARDRGVARLHGEVLRSNARMLAFVQRLGFAVTEGDDTALLRAERSTGPAQRAARRCAATAPA